MFLFHRNGDGPAFGALIDIGSGTVGVAIVASNSKEKLPTILYTKRIMMRVAKQGTHKSEDVRRVREALFSAALALSQEGQQALFAHNPRAKITKLYVTCSSPWSYTVARNVRYEDDESFKVTQSVIDDLVQSAESEILSHLEEHSYINEKEFEVVERATVDITVNDYTVASPLHLSGTTLGLSHIAGVVPKELMEALHEVQSKLFPNTELRVHTYMLVMYCVMRDLFPRLHSLCIVDITGEATEFGIVENNLLIENTFAPYGSNTFIRDAMHASGKPMSDISTSIQAQADMHMTESAELQPQIEAYEQVLTDTIRHILARRTLPTSIIITAHRPYEQFFRQILARTLSSVTDKKLSIVSIEQNIVDEISHGAGNDVYLALGARFFHKLHGCGEPTNQ
jgi:cell division ATPase FtsA